MTFCQGCGHQIHETAVSCPQCGAVQKTAAVRSVPSVDGTLWLPVPALICGLIPVIALFDPHAWDNDQVLGAFLFSIVALALGVIGLTRQARGRGMSIAALVLGVIGLLGAIGTQV